MSLSRRARSELEWWVANVMTAKNVMIRDAPLHNLTTDASNEGWGRCTAISQQGVSAPQPKRITT